MTQSRRIITILTIAILMMCALEGLVRVFLPVSDYPYVIPDTDLGTRRTPNREGRWVYDLGRDINARWHTNAQGWNASEDYILMRTDQPRIAVIGDSFVEAREIDTDEAMPELLPGLLGCDIESYRFAQAGAPLSHYWALMQEAAKYRPDWYVLVIVGNDFDESLAPYDNSYKWSFIPDGRGGYTPEAPGVFFYDPYVRLLDYSAVRRFLRGNIAHWETGGAIMPRMHPVRHRADDISSSEVEAFTHYIFREYARIARAHGGHILVMVDPDRRTIYGIDRNMSYMRPKSLNYSEAVELVKIAAQENGMTYLDLEPLFVSDYEKTGQQLNFETDFHWNERGHRLVAKAIASQIRGDVCH